MIYQDDFIYILVKVGDPGEVGEVGELGDLIPIMSISRDGSVRDSSIVVAIEEKVSFFKDRRVVDGKLPYEITFAVYGEGRLSIEGIVRTDDEDCTAITDKYLIRLIASQVVRSIPKAVKKFDKR